MSKTLILMFISKYSRRALKTNGEIMEANIINMFGFIFKDVDKTMFKSIQIALLKSWSKYFVNDSKL
jgi:hypothetical protein